MCVGESEFCVDVVIFLLRYIEQNVNLVVLREEVFVFFII